MTKLHKIKAFVLKRTILLGKDSMVTLFAKDQGKTTVLVKGVRKFTSKRAAHLQTGNLIQAQIHETNGITYLQSSELISGFMSLRTSAYIDHLYLLLATVDGLIPEGQSENQVFILMKQFFAGLGNGREPQTVLRRTLQHILEILGYVDRQYSLSELMTIIEENMGKRLPKSML